jgi:hypothetical protein
VETANRAALGRFWSYLESRREELGVADFELAAFVCGTAIEALAHNADLHNRDMASDDSVDALVDETTRLIVGYLKGH